MKPTLPLGLRIGWGRLVAVFVVDVAVLWLGGVLGGRAGWWAAAVLAAALSAVTFVTWRNAPVVELVLRAVHPKGTLASATAGELADYNRTYGSGPVGIRSVGPHLVAVVAVDGPAHSPSALDHHRVASLATLPIAAIAAGMRQFDVTLESIDVVSVGIRRAADRHHSYGAVYSSLVGDHPAVGQRRTWLVVRFDADRSARAVLCRESVAATVGAAAQWLAEELTSRRCPARALNAAEIRQADTELLAGIDPDELTSGWGRLHHSNGYVQTYWMSPRDIASDTLDRLWVPDTDATAVTVQLRPTAEGATTVGVLVRYHTGAPLAEPPLTGLNPLTGRHDLGLVSGSLAARGHLAVPSRTLTGDEPKPLNVAIGATGVIVGANATGHPLLVDLSSPTGTSTVTLAGELALTVQVALRAAATGYQVLVCTDRPKQWKQVTGAGLQLVGPGGLQELPPTRRRWVVVYDRVNGVTPQGAAVTVRTVPAGTASGADIHIEQDGARSAVIRTWAFRVRMRIDLDYERQHVSITPRIAA